MANTIDLKSIAERLVGSSPTRATIKRKMKTYNVGVIHKIKDKNNIFYPEVRIQLASHLSKEEAENWVNNNSEKYDMKEDKEYENDEI